VGGEEAGGRAGEGKNALCRSPRPSAGRPARSVMPRSRPHPVGLS